MNNFLPKYWRTKISPGAPSAPGGRGGGGAEVSGQSAAGWSWVRVSKPPSSIQLRHIVAAYLGAPSAEEGQFFQVELLDWAQRPLYQSGMIGISSRWIFWILEMTSFMPSMSSVLTPSSSWTSFQASLFSYRPKLTVFCVFWIGRLNM